MDRATVERALRLLHSTDTKPSTAMSRREAQLARISAELDSHPAIVSARIRQHRYLPPANRSLR